MVAGIEQQARQNPDGWALRSSDHVLSWSELNARVNRAVHVILAADLDPERRVAVFAENSVETAVAHLAGLFAGVCVVPVNVHLRAGEAAYILGNCGAQLVLAGDRTAVTAAEAAPPGARVLAWNSPGVAGIESFEDALLGAPSAEPPADLIPRPNLMYTSGTSGRPKGVILPPSMFAGGSSMHEHVENLRELSLYAGRGPHLVVGPAYHTGPLAGLRSLATGTPVVMTTRFDAENVLESIDRHRVGTTLMVPTHFTRLLALPEQVRANYDVSSLVHVTHTGAPCPVEVKQAMIEWFGPVLLDAYGSTETGTIAKIDSIEWAAHPGSVGRATPNYAITIRDESGKELPAGEEGLVCVRSLAGQGPTYFDDPQKTADSYLVPGEFAIGEIGYLDGEGYLYLTDRHSDLVVSGGVNVYPAEAEAVLIQHSDVADVAVIGVPDDEMGENLHGIVVSVTGDTSAAQLVAWCRERLTHYKCPRTIDFTHELPRNGMGKVDKRALQSRHLAALDRARA